MGHLSPWLTAISHTNPLASENDIIWHSTHQNSAVCTHQVMLIQVGLTQPDIVLYVLHPLQWHICV